MTEVRGWSYRIPCKRGHPAKGLDGDIAGVGEQGVARGRRTRAFVAIVVVSGDPEVEACGGRQPNLKPRVGGQREVGDFYAVGVDPVSSQIAMRVDRMAP